MQLALIPPWRVPSKCKILIQAALIRFHVECLT